VRLLIVDPHAIGMEQLGRLMERHGGPPVLLLAHATSPTPTGPWQRVLQRPVSVADVVGAVEDLLPLPKDARGPVD
jgi:hypothetical protein